MTRERLKPDARYDKVLDGAVRAAVAHGYDKFTREQVAQRAGCSPALVSHYFGSMIEVRAAVMQFAIDSEVLWLVAQGIALGDQLAVRAPVELRRRAVAALEQRAKR